VVFIVPVGFIRHVHALLAVDLPEVYPAEICKPVHSIEQILDDPVETLCLHVILQENTAEHAAPAEPVTARLAMVAQGNLTPIAI